MKFTGATKFHRKSGEGPAAKREPSRKPDFLLAALERPACAVFCKENRMKLAASPTSTGNPGVGEALC
jgi:hypothetical protein